MAPGASGDRSRPRAVREPTSFGCVTQAPGSYQDNELLQTFVTDAEASPARLCTEALNGLNQPYLIADRRGLSPTRGPSLIYYLAS